MESRFVAAKRNNVSLSEVEERLPCPPRGGPPQRKGKAVEDFGRSFARKDSGSQGKAKQVNRRQAPISNARQHDMHSDSGDELDILTQTSDSNARRAVQKKSKEKRKEEGYEPEFGHVGSNQKPQKKTIADLGLKFKKNKGTTDRASDLTPVNTNPPLDAPKEEGTNSQIFLDSWPPSPRRSQNLDSRNKGPSTSRHMPSVNASKLPEKRTTTDRPKPRLLRQAKSPQSKPTTTRNARPQPRPSGSQSKPQTDFQTGAALNARSPACRHTGSEHRPFPLSPPDSENVDPSNTRRSPPVEKPTPAAFPLLSPVASPARPSAFPSLTPLFSPEERARSVPKKRVTQGSPKTPRITAGKRGKDTNPFPVLSPLSSLPKAANEASGRSKVKTKCKSVYICESEDEDSDVEGSDQPKAQPFPMITQVLNSIGTHDTPLRAGPSRQGKRSSSDGTDTEQIRKRIKKSRTDENMELPAFNDYTYDDDDTLVISPSTDPRTLCPYCDSPLPNSPTSLLTRLLVTTETKSSPDPRLTNPLGRKAPFTVFIAVCQRHRFESEILPEAEHKGWPKEIEWTKLGERVGKLRGRLKALVDDVGGDSQGCGDNEGQDEDSLFTDDEGRSHGDFARRESSPRSSCVFWREVMAEVKMKGSRAVAGVRGQFASFEKTQPGYYGELGSVIIHQTLYDLFPPASIDPNVISPLTVNEFIQRILVPEVGVRLIMEDRGLEGEEGIKTAVSILRESASYGVAMFPEDGGEWGTGTNARGRRGRKGSDADEMGVADRIVMERARKRRKELEEEGEQVGGMGMETEIGELQVASDMEIEDGKLTRPRLRRKKELEPTKKRKDKAQEVQPPRAEALPPRPRPRPLSKSGSSASVLTSGKITDTSPHGSQSMDDGVDTDVSERATPLQRRLKGKPSLSDLAQQTGTDSDAETKVTTRLAVAISTGSTVLDLCSTDDDTERKDDRSAEGARNRHGTVANKRPAPESTPEADDTKDDAVELVTPVIQRISPVSVELDGELEETPRPRASGRSCEPQTPAVTDANFHPLAAARERQKRSGSVSNTCPSTPSSHSWLLSDSSQSLD